MTENEILLELARMRRRAQLRRETDAMSEVYQALLNRRREHYCPTDRICLVCMDITKESSTSVAA